MKKQKVVWIAIFLVILVVLASPATAADDWLNRLNNTLEENSAGDLNGDNAPYIPGSIGDPNYNPNQAGANNILLVIVVIIAATFFLIAATGVAIWMLKYRHAQKMVAKQS